MAIGRKGKSTSSKLAILCIGDVGTHKSEMLLESTKMVRPDGKPCRVLYLDVEQGSVDDRLERFAKDGVDLDNLYIIYTQSYEEVIEFVNKVKNKEDFYSFDEDGNETDEIILDADGKPFRPDFICVDGAKLLNMARQQTYLERSKVRADVRATKKENITSKEKQVMKDGAKLEPTDYQQLKFDGASLVLSLVGSGCHFAISSFGKPEMELDPAGGKDGFGNPKKRPTGRIINDGFDGVMEYCKTILCLTTDEYGEVRGYIQDKDRTETFPAGSVIENPHLTMWQNVITKSANSKPVANSLKKSIDKDTKELMKDELPKEDVILANNVTISVADLRKEINARITSGDVKLNRAKLKENGLGNPAKILDSDIETLKKYLEVLK